jgi:hypothetical protein
MNIKVTDFAYRHFDKNFGGTKVLNMTIEEFTAILTTGFGCLEDMNTIIKLNGDNHFKTILGNARIIEGYAPFCKLLVVPNFTDVKVGSMPITLENYQYLRSGYSPRTDDELPIFSRWLELPLGKPIAEWLVLVLYSKEQIEIESKGKDNATEIFGFDADWGIVAILGQSHPNEEHMKPETMIRNAGYNTEEFQKIAVEQIMGLIEKGVDEIANLIEVPDEGVCNKDIREILSLQGVMCGGSGVPLNKEKYLASVDFWSKNATVL